MQIKRKHYQVFYRIILNKFIKRNSILILWIFCILILAIIINIQVNILRNHSRGMSEGVTTEYREDKFRELKISSDCLEYFIQKGKVYDKEYIPWITTAMLKNGYDLSNVKKESIKTTRFHKKISSSKAYKDLNQKYSAVFSDLVYFPIPVDLSNGETVNFSNSWMGERTYGGKRFHEGTDIMTSNNQRGYYPVLSITDGKVEQKGWLEKGGYRIGVRANNGAYFYYAHLHSYANGLEIDDQVKAGELLGFMGDTGYSKVEGTTGNFDVHLHLGIYLNTEDGEISVNPYWVLKYLENHKLQYYY